MYASEGGTTVPKNGKYYRPYGDKIDLYAEPDEGWEFDHWLIDGHTKKKENPYTLKLNNDYEARAIFKSNKILSLGESGDNYEENNIGENNTAGNELQDNQKKESILSLIWRKIKGA